ncbi:DHA2 family efflux MFS transporter permease subunit [Deinococcus psychrotolerans]|uniref:DHA2 family efflux MFS transporter permease subunit n=1 Tax=Deinococcus psychrotolerans TaxID=2489213 RepID=A0A3G8YFJ2_9DEIO|nr:MDR family MFS transporter [Deinococcus psychrotolerans]AZI43640.1 DHA2 family efflux MFS transporter permease subunit [Deinococcus psychrotolerans]
MTQPAPPTQTTRLEDRINYAEVLPQSTKILILIGTLLGLFLAALDQTIVSTSLPRIIADLNGLNLYSWVTTAYLLASTAMVPIYGKLSDIYGRKPVLLFGIVVFLIGSALCGMAGEPWFGNLFGGGMMQLIVFRGLQGFGAAALTSVAFSIIADIFAPAERAKYQGLFGAVFGISSVIGPLLGGFLTDNISWRWVFYVNLPVGLIAIAFITSKMPILASGLKPKIDYVGALLVLTFSVPLLLALTFGAEANYGWTNSTVLALFAASVVSLILFLFVESRHESPILPLSLFKNPTFAWGVTARFFLGAAFLGAILFLSLYLVNVQGVSATKAGTATIPLTMGLIFGSIVSGQIAARLGIYKPLILVGLALMVGGFYLLSTLTADTPYWTVIVFMVVLGLGIGPALPLYNLAIQSSVQRWEIGVATSSGQFFQQMGSTIGTAVFGAVLTSTLATQLPAQLRVAATNQKPAIAAQLETAAASASKASASQGGGSAPTLDSINAKINDGFAKTFGSVQTAVQSGNLSAITQNQLLPEGLRTGLAQIPPAALQTEQGKAQALARIKAQLDTIQASTLADAKTTYNLSSRAFKVGFANTVSRIYLIAIFVALLAFLTTLPMPNLRLPRKGEGPGGEQRGGLASMEG